MKKLMLFMTFGLFVLFIVLFTYAPFAKALSVDIIINANTPPISPELSNYIGIIQAQSPSPIIGFNGTDIGDGLGNARDEMVPFSFTFTPLASITSATLSLNLTASHLAGLHTDYLLFEDNSSIFIPEESRKFYGNDILISLTSYTNQEVTFDLTNIGTNLGYEGTCRFSNYMD